jgi:ribosomal protein L32
MMNVHFIYEKLSTQNHYPHFLSKYINFLHACQSKNTITAGLEKHHALPKSLFPEYESFREHPWNMFKLTPRQHFIAHRLLWKAIPNNYNITYACFRMSRYGKHKISSKEYSRLKLEYRAQQSTRTALMHQNMSPEDKAIISTKISISQRNMVQAVDENGQNVKVHKDVFDSSPNLKGHTKGMISVKTNGGKMFMVERNDPRFISGELVGVNKGRSFSDETKLLWSMQRKGKHKSEEAKAAMRKPKPLKTCPHCGKTGGANTITRYHFDNCKHR